MISQSLRLVLLVFFNIAAHSWDKKKNTPKIKSKKIIILFPAAVWQILNMKQWSETEIKRICWNLLGKIREITLTFYELIFRQVSVIKNHCGVGAVRCPFHGQGNTRITTDWPRCMSTWHQLLQWVDNNSGTFSIFIYYLNFWRNICKIF